MEMERLKSERQEKQFEFERKMRHEQFQMPQSSAMGMSEMMMVNQLMQQPVQSCFSFTINIEHRHTIKL